MKNTGTFKALGDLPDDVIENFKNHEYDVCKEKCTHILSSEPNNGFAHIYLGKIAESEQDHETAITHYKRVTEIEPRFIYIWSSLGGVYATLKRHKEAYEAFREEIALTPQKALPWCMASLSAQSMGDRELALGILAIAQKNVDEQEQSLIAFALGALQEFAGDHDEALINYVQGQIQATSEEDKILFAERIYKMLEKE